MKKYLINTAAFLVMFTLLVFIMALASSYYVSRNNFNNWEAESDLLIIKENQHYDLLFTGISHARNFSRHENHQRVEKLLDDRKIINLGRGSSLCGTFNLDFYLDYFYENNNSCDTVVYFLSPSMMYAKFLDDASNSFIDEPFIPGFFLKYLVSDAPNKYEKLFYYIRSKFTYTWIKTMPYSKKIMVTKLDSLDGSKIKEGMKLAYLDGHQQKIFDRNGKIIENTIIRAREHNSAVIFVIPPALFGKWKGHNETMAFLNGLREKYNITYYDFSESVMEPNYYYDHHHLNTAGVEYFIANFLKPVI